MAVFGDVRCGEIVFHGESLVLFGDTYRINNGYTIYTKYTKRDTIPSRDFIVN